MIFVFCSSVSESRVMDLAGSLLARVSRFVCPPRQTKNQQEPVAISHPVISTHPSGLITDVATDSSLNFGTDSRFLPILIGWSISRKTLKNYFENCDKKN